MGGASGFLQLHSTCSEFALPGHLCVRNGGARSKRSRAPKASMRQEGSSDSVWRSRRAFLFVGVAVFPLLQLRARAVEGLVADEQLATPISEGVDNKKDVTKSETSSTPPVLSFLNGVGIIGSGILGALYVLARQEKTASEAKIELLTKNLSDKEAAFRSMQKSFETKLLSEQEEHTKQIKKAKDEQLASVTQLDSANSTITRLGQELQREKKLLQEVQAQVVSFQTLLSTLREEKEGLEVQLKEKVDVIEILQEKINLLSSDIKKKEEDSRSLASSLSERESELKELKAAYLRSTEELEKSNSEINTLRIELQKAQKELGLKNSTVDDLNAQIGALIVERDVSYRRIDEMQKQYKVLKSASEEKAVVDAELLRKRDLEIAQLGEKLELALNEVSSSKLKIADLTMERDNLKEMLHMEVNHVKTLRDELRITQGSLETLRNEASDLEEMLKRSRQLCNKLESEVSKVRAEFTETKLSLHRSLDEAKQTGALLATELGSANDLLKKTIDELQAVSNELVAAQKINEDLKKELIDVSKVAEAAGKELKEEKKVVDSLNNELKTLEKQILTDKEGRKSLEMDLDEATKSLDQMNRNTLLLSKELDIAKCQISNLEDEKDVIYRSLAEQKSISQATRENLEDAHNLVMRLGTERENLDRRAKKLEEELAAAKGEILRLRSRVNSSKTSSIDTTASNRDTSEKGEVQATTVAVSTKKTTRRKKSSET